MKILVLTTLINRSKLHNETFIHYSKMLEEHDVTWVFNLDRIDKLKDTNNRTRLNVKRLVGTKGKKFEFITTNQSWFNQAVRNLLNSAKKYIDNVDVVLYLEDDWIPINKNILPDIESLILSSAGKRYKNKDFIICLSERIWLTNQYINFQPQLWSVSMFKKFIEIFEDNQDNETSPEVLLEKGYYSKYNLEGVIVDRYKFFKDYGRKYMVERGLIKRNKFSNNYAGKDATYKVKPLKFESYVDYVNKCKRKETGWDACTFTMDINGEEVGITLPDNYDDIITKIRSELNSRLENGEYSNDVRGIVSLIDRPLDIPEVIKLGSHFAKELSEKLYGGPCYVTYVHPYRNNIVNEKEGASWIWHYDNVAPGILKILVYLTDTTSETGAFLALRNNQGKYPLIEPSAFSPERYVRPKYTDSRLTKKDIQDFKNQGYEDYYIEGKAGTFLLFNNNIIHKATIPKKEPERLCIIYHFRPFYDDVEEPINKKITGDWGDNSRSKSKKYQYLTL